MLCRIYKKTNTQRSPLDHERDDSMEDLIGLGGVASSINLGQMNSRFHLSKMSALSYGGTSLLDNHHHHHHHHDHQNLLEGVISSTNNKESSSSDLQLPFVPTMSGSTASNSNTKRTLSSLYNWGNNSNEDDQDVVNGTKRLGLVEDHHHTHSNNNEVGGNSIANLLNQIPQTPSLHHQTMLGSYPYSSIPGMNWFA